MILHRRYHPEVGTVVALGIGMLGLYRPVSFLVVALLATFLWSTPVFAQENEEVPQTNGGSFGLELGGGLLGGLVGFGASYGLGSECVSCGLGGYFLGAAVYFGAGIPSTAAGTYFAGEASGGDGNYWITLGGLEWGAPSVLGSFFFPSRG